MQYICLNCSYAPTKLNICPVWLSYTVTQPVTYFPVERCQARHSPSWRGQEVPCHMQDTLQRTHPPSPQTFLLYKPNRQQISVKHFYFHNITNATPYNCEVIPFPYFLLIFVCLAIYTSMQNWNIVNWNKIMKAKSWQYAIMNMKQMLILYGICIFMVTLFQ